MMNRQQMGESLNLKIKMIPVGQKNRPGTRIAATSITLHNTSNTGAGADAAAHARFVTETGFYTLASGRKNWVSWHYTVDDKECYKHLPINEKAWHAGPANASSIGIETCMNAGIDQAAADDRLARLVAVLRFDLGLRRSDIKSHRDWTGKNCPILLLPKWDRLMDRIDHYVAEIEAAEGASPQIAFGVAEADEGIDTDTDHEAMALAVSGAAPALATPAIASPVPVAPAQEGYGAIDPMTMDPDEPDEGFVYWPQSILAYDDRAAVEEVITASAFSTFTSYKAEFAASYQDMHIRNFKPHEFLTMGGSNSNPSARCYNKNSLPPRALWPNMRPLARALDEIRNRLGAPVKLTSVYRNPAYNGCLSGTASNSFHMQFKAADFQCAKGSPTDWRRVAQEVRSAGVFTGGIGIYNTFVHVDVRGQVADWDNR
ncbi:N-acetylmuramoyl-L-alanine amidase [Salipiger sp. H15]|uniref:N-acetylmuramoyl-L-alanine amidase n=1 Tax=Alloyangia sp. H15 TaxID=3029062 RepID=A0AAU8APH0_9RHOB